MPGKISKIPDNVVGLIKSFFEPQAIHIPDKLDFEHLIYSSCKLAVNNIGMTLAPMEGIPKMNTIEEWVQYMADKSNLRMRRVSLYGDWHKFDNGPLVVFDRESMIPYAAIPNSFGEYEIYNPVTGKKVDFKRKNSNLLRNDLAFSFYPSLPSKPLGWKDILYTALASQKNNLRYLAFLYTILGLMGLIIPTITGVVIDRVIPNADIKLLHQVLLGLCVVSISTVLFTAAQSLIFMRIKLKINAILQPALWDRVLKLPVLFFRDYTTGDLSSRIKSIDYIQQAISATTFFAIMSGLFSVIGLVLLFVFNITIGFIVLGITALYVIVAILVNLKLMTYFAKYFEIHGKILGMLFQVILNVSKLRLMRREENICSTWMSVYLEKTSLYYKSEMLTNGLSVLISVIQILSTLLLFFIVIINRDTISLGTFIVINSIYGQYFASISSMLNSITSFIELIPHSKRASPLIKSDLEISSEKQDPGELSGEIIIKNLYFSYKNSDKSVLKDVSLKVEAGRCVTLIGSSGAGKSTLLRLLLGFESPTSGEIYYDGKNLNSLNAAAVRKQMGVILQNTSLMPGTIFDNITNFDTSLTSEQVQEIIKLLGMDDFINSLPMGLQTLLTESAGTFSMGQRQCILLARALIRKPRILFLDESTSALDQMVQARINKVLNDLKVTRIIITQNVHAIKSTEPVYKIENNQLIAA